MPISVWLVGLQREEVAACYVGLRAIGSSVTALQSFNDARMALGQIPPDIMVMPIRLGGFNGIHLAIVAQSIPQKPVLTIVIDQPGGAFFKEACDAGSYCLMRPVNVEELVGLVRRITRGPTPRRLASRVRSKAAAAVSHGCTAPAQVIDFSDTGMRLEVLAVGHPPLPDVVHVAVAEHQVTLRRVWQRWSGGTIHCGLSVDEATPRSARRWRQLRDHLIKH
jgi:DNA-binding response OmpR family regulator